MSKSSFNLSYTGSHSKSSFNINLILERLKNKGGVRKVGQSLYRDMSFQPFSYPFVWNGQITFLTIQPFYFGEIYG